MRLERRLQRDQGVLHFVFARHFCAMMPRISSGHGNSDRIHSSSFSRSPRDVSPMRRTLSWRRLHQIFFVLRPVAGDGVCAAHGSRELARFGGGARSAPSVALPDGISRAGRAEHTGRCERTPRLAHLRRLGADTHSTGAQAVRQGAFRSRTATDGLRARRHGDRSVFEPFSLGATFAPPKRQSNCTPCWICAAPSRPLSL